MDSMRSFQVSVTVHVFLHLFGPDTCMLESRTKPKRTKPHTDKTPQDKTKH